MLRRKISQFLINPRFQLKVVGLLLIGSTFTSLCFFFANSYFFTQFVQLGKDLQLNSDHIFFKIVDKQRSVMDSVFLVVALGVSVMTALMGVILSHRVVGPFYRLHQHLIETAKTKKYVKLDFRKTDFFPELAQAYNDQLPPGAAEVPSKLISTP